MWKWSWIVVLVIAATTARAGETETRETIKTQMREAFAKGDYQRIEARYAAALSSSERTASGTLVAGLVVMGMIPKPIGESAVPGREDHWDTVDRKVKDWARQFPNSVLPAIAQSRSFHGRAWSWRGTGYARTVAPEGWKKSSEYAQRAFDALMAREAAGRTDPNWYVQMIDVARLQSWPRDRFLALVTEATQAFPSCDDIYFSAAWSMVPRWGGSAAEVAQFADYAVGQTRKAQGETMYARIYWSVAQGLDTPLSSPQVNWKRIRAGFDDMIKRHPDPRNLNFYAKFACEAHDYATAKRVLARMGDDIDPDAWGERSKFVRCKQLAASASGGE